MRISTRNLPGLPASEGERRPLIDGLSGTPEDMFLAWLFGLPDQADVAHAAHVEIARIDDRASSSDEALRLRALLHQATLNQPPHPRGRMRRRH